MIGLFYYEKTRQQSDVSLVEPDYTLKSRKNQVSSSLSRCAYRAAVGDQLPPNYLPGAL